MTLCEYRPGLEGIPATESSVTFFGIPFVVQEYLSLLRLASLKELVLSAHRRSYIGAARDVEAKDYQLLFTRYRIICRGIVNSSIRTHNALSTSRFVTL